MNKDSITGDMIDVCLRQMGASKIEEIQSCMHLVNFDLDDGLVVSYVFNITKNNKYFLQRMRPYAIAHGKFAAANEIIEFIRLDIAKFRNAQKSHNFKQFLTASEKGNELVMQLESLFLNHNVKGEVLAQFVDNLQDLIETVQTHNKDETLIHISATDAAEPKTNEK